MSLADYASAHLTASKPHGEEARQRWRRPTRACSDSSSRWPLFKDHKILTQVAGHGLHTIKLLQPLTITDDDCKWIGTAFESVIAASHEVPGAIRSLGKTLVDNAVRKSA